MLKKYTFNFLYLILVFALLEIGSRVFFSEFNENNIFYDKNEFHRVSKGKDTFFQYINETQFRVSKLNEKILFNDKKSIWFLGDSITNGYGVNFEDTYYSIFKKEFNKDVNVYASSKYGYNFKNTFSNLNKTIIKHIKENDIVIYQFNFNDILEIAKKSSNIKNDDIPGKRKFISFINDTNIFRYKYLNHSTFFKVLQHYASIAVRKTNGDCLNRKIDALGPYTYAYFAKGYEDKSLELWKIFIKDLKIMSKKLELMNVNFFVLIPPISLDVYNHDKINKLKYDLKCSTKNGAEYIKKNFYENEIDFIDTLPSFNYFSKKTSNKDKLLFHSYDTNHPNELGHKLIALEILKKLNTF